jgi:NitT/TauT family transport system substrate-binding protein
MIYSRQILTAFFVLFVIVTAPRANSKTLLEVGYLPILPVSQLFVALENNWLREAEIEVKLVRFQNGPAMVQALLAGQLDVAHFGIGPAMVARAKGADIKVVAASIKEQISFLALGELAPYFKSDPSKAFAKFRADKGRKAVISTFPVGSVPQTVLQYWLLKKLGANPDDLQIIYQGSAQVQQALATGAVDAAAILEPIVTKITQDLENSRVVAKGSQMFKGQPGAVLAVREKLISDNPKVVAALVKAHARATDVLNNYPREAIGPVKKYVGGGRLSETVVSAAINSSKGSFIADPNSIIEGTKRMRDFQKEIGTLKVNVNVDALIETKFFDALNR